MYIRYADGITPDRVVRHKEEAIHILNKQFPNAYFGGWEENLLGDRFWISVWENYNASVDDDGEGAVAWIKTSDVREVA